METNPDDPVHKLRLRLNEAVKFTTFSSNFFFTFNFVFSIQKNFEKNFDDYNSDLKNADELLSKQNHR
jgi:hypothetical protein